MTKYFLYARKSTDETRRQVRSLDAQIREANEFATLHNLTIVELFQESKSAKATGRPLFNEMINRIQDGEADGILAWHPNRIARNAYDGGVVIDLIDRNILTDLKFVSYTFSNTPEGKMMLFNVFAQSKYEVDKMSVETKRGLREKFLRGEWPGPAPIGYLNDRNTKRVVKDPCRSNLVRRLFELYQTGIYSLDSLRQAAIQFGLMPRRAKTFTTGMIHLILQNQFYYGYLRYGGELRKGIHEPLISKELFDTCQRVLARRHRPTVPGPEGLDFRGFITCADCGGPCTTEKQKGHVYYRCTKKRGPCDQPYIRYEKVKSQVTATLAKLSLSPEWAECFMRVTKEHKRELQRIHRNESASLEAQIQMIDSRIDRLLELRFNGELTKDDFLHSKNKLVAQRADLEQKLAELIHTTNSWLEPVRTLISTGGRAAELQKSSKDFDQRRFLEKLGSNPVLSHGTINFGLPDCWKIVVNSGYFGPAAKPVPRSPDAFSRLYPILVRFLCEARISFATHTVSDSSKRLGLTYFKTSVRSHPTMRRQWDSNHQSRS
jgi:DNA invertase Pin-like site-specific DNA recombinase